MSATPSFSVVIPCFNYGHYLAECIGSVLRQERDDVEILVIDDASSDDTATVAARYGDKIDYVRNPVNLGAGGAWKVGLSRARGKYLIKLDADDMLLSGHLDALARAFESDDEIGVVVASVWVKKENRGVIEEELVCDKDTTLNPDELRSRLMHGFFFRMPGCALRRNITVHHSLPDPELYQVHDWEYFLRITKGHKARLLAAPGAIYRIHGASITATAQFNDRLYGDLSRWLAVASVPGERFLAEDEFRALCGSFGELMLIGFGPKLQPSSYVRYFDKYLKAVGFAAQGGVAQILRLHRYLAGKVLRKLLGLGRSRIVDFSPP